MPGPHPKSPIPPHFGVPAQFFKPTASVHRNPAMIGKRAVVFAHRRLQPGCRQQVAMVNDLRAPSAKRISNKVA